VANFFTQIDGQLVCVTTAVQPLEVLIAVTPLPIIRSLSPAVSQVVAGRLLGESTLHTGDARLESQPRSHGVVLVGLPFASHATIESPTHAVVFATQAGASGAMSASGTSAFAPSTDSCWLLLWQPTETRHKPRKKRSSN
jgi:hypothetical protein